MEGVVKLYNIFILVFNPYQKRHAAVINHKNSKFNIYSVRTRKVERIEGVC